MFDIYQLDRGLTNCLFEKLKLIWWFIKCFMRQISSLRHQIVDLLRAIPKARVETKFPSCQQYLTQELLHSWGPDRSYVDEHRIVSLIMWTEPTDEIQHMGVIPPTQLKAQSGWIWWCSSDDQLMTLYRVRQCDKCDLSWQVFSSMNL